MTKRELLRRTYWSLWPLFGRPWGEGLISIPGLGRVRLAWPAEIEAERRKELGK